MIIDQVIQWLRNIYLLSITMLLPVALFMFLDKKAASCWQKLNENPGRMKRAGARNMQGLQFKVTGGHHLTSDGIFVS
jgi:hypothetical protein